MEAIQDETLFDATGFETLQTLGYLLIPHFLKESLRQSLYEEACACQARQAMQQAHIGQGRARHIDQNIRGDVIYWLDGATPAQRTLLNHIHTLQHSLNRHFYLGLNGYEAHFAIYPPGRRYQKHWDNFRGQGSRIITTLFYLNPEWSPEWGGQLRLYHKDEQTLLAEIFPQPGMMLLFLSADIPHEVCPPTRPRVSIAGWLRRDPVPLPPLSS